MNKALEIVDNILDNFGGEKVQIETMTLSKCGILTIKQALLKAQEHKDPETQEIYLIYCVNNYHNIYMDYRGQPCNYSDATLFKDKFEAHQFLRKNNQDEYYAWAVVNNKDLTDYEKRRID